jgi:hypothetical protein
VSRRVLIALASALMIATPVSQALAAGDGTFTAAPDSPFGAGSTPDALAVIDFDGDGSPDLVAANRDSNDLTFLVDSAGSFTAGPAPVPVGAGPSDIETEDFNQDGLPDFAVASAGGNTVTVFSRTATGFATTPVSVPNTPTRLAAGDFDGNTDPDLGVIRAQFGRVGILQGAAEAGFTVNGATQGIDSPSDLAAADFDGTKGSDLAVTSNLLDRVRIFTGNGNGTLGTAGEVTVGNAPRDLIAADFNGDGDPDLAVTNSGSDDVSILLGTAGGPGFSPAATIPVQDEPSALVASDLNGDGIADLAVANQASAAATGSVSVLLGQGGGAFVPAPGSPIAVGNQPLAIVAADFNDDTATDLATANGGSDNISVLLGNPPAAPPPGGGDNKPPETTIDKGPSGKTHKTKAKIRFSANEPSTFECRLKGKGVDQGDGGFFPCNKGKIKFKHLALGKKKFQVRATDAAGNTDQTPAKIKWKVVR